MTQITMNENGTDVHYDSFPSSVTVQYLSKEGEPLNSPVNTEFYTLASYLLWAMSIANGLRIGSNEYDVFAYFVATRPVDMPIELETQYVRRVYTFSK